MPIPSAGCWHELGLCQKSGFYPKPLLLGTSTTQSRISRDEEKLGRTLPAFVVLLLSDMRKQRCTWQEHGHANAAIYPEADK